VLRVASLLFQKELGMTEFYPGTLVVEVDEPIAFVPTLEVGLLEEAAASGVQVFVHFSADESGDWFNFGTGPGWGDGVWIGVV
jgi:hypothetical protein